MIRTAEDRDRDALYDVCLRCGDAGKDATGLLDDPELLGAVYVGPYLALEPATCLTLDLDGPAGYALGTPDTAAFQARAEQQWWPALRARYPLDGARRELDAALVAEIWTPPVAPADVVAEWPAHLHIDLLERARGTGWGKRLMTELMDRLAVAGASGVHLMVATSNADAIRFYRRLGFATMARDDDTDVMARDFD